MPGRTKELDLEIVVPVEDMAEPGAPNFPNAEGVPAEGEPLAHVRSIWPAIYPELLELVQEHTSTIIFVNTRRGAERLAKRLNELANGRSPSRSCRRPSTPGNGAQVRPATRPATEPLQSRSPAPTTAPSSHEERTVVEEMLKSGSCPAWSRPRRWSWGSTWARSTW